MKSLQIVGREDLYIYPDGRGVAAPPIDPKSIKLGQECRVPVGYKVVPPGPDNWQIERVIGLFVEICQETGQWCGVHQRRLFQLFERRLRSDRFTNHRFSGVLEVLASYDRVSPVAFEEAEGRKLGDRIVYDTFAIYYPDRKFFEPIDLIAKSLYAD